MLAPFIIGVLVAIKTEQVLRGRPRDPLFYRETRMSMGQPFTFYKFNIFKYEQVLALRASGTLVHTKELEHHGGVLRVGWLLKQVYMDELPQLYNVLRGEMSLVGPRPMNLAVYEDLKRNGVTDKDRVPAGITGLFQSDKGHHAIDAVQADRFYADFYEKNSGLKVLLFDLRIIAKTIIVILQAKGI
jgi:lipopolysaccharide/colanic/teichoic acid biosynthesis glycosyltransferase